jgi:hypothetical protein
MIRRAGDQSGRPPAAAYTYGLVQLLVQDLSADRGCIVSIDFSVQTPMALVAYSDTVPYSTACTCKDAVGRSKNQVAVGCAMAQG